MSLNTKCDRLKSETWPCNEQLSIPVHTNTFAKLIHSMYVPMHGMCWVSAVPYLCMCMWWMCRCLCSSVVLGMFWHNAWVDIGYLCCVVCECICVTACMSASVSLFVSLLMNYVRHVQMSKYWCFWMGVENTRRWGSVPEMDVWGQAPHHMHNTSSY